MNAPLPKSPLVRFVRCRAKDCGWKADPDRRMSLDNQAEEHTKQTTHPTSSGFDHIDRKAEQ